jgi:flagellar biosynthesis component FlhA
MKNSFIALLSIGATLLVIHLGIQFSKCNQSNNEEAAAEDKKRSAQDSSFKHWKDSLIQATLDYTHTLDSITAVIEKENKETERWLAEFRKKLKEQDEEHERKMSDIRKLSHRSVQRNANHQTRQGNSTSSRVKANPQRQYDPKDYSRRYPLRQAIDSAVGPANPPDKIK